MKKSMNERSAPKYKAILRALEPEDIDLLYHWENDQKIWHISNTLVPFSRYILQKYLEDSHLDIFQLKQLRLMIDVTRPENPVRFTVGAVDLFDYEPLHNRAGVGILIGHEADRGLGYASAALDELIRYAFGTLQLHQLYCNITTDNSLSLNLFEKKGFTRSGLRKQWLKGPDGYKDVWFLQLLKVGVTI